MKSSAHHPIKFPQHSLFKAHLGIKQWNDHYRPGCEVIVVDDDGEEWSAVAADKARVEGDVAVLDLVDHDTPVWLCRVWPARFNTDPISPMLKYDMDDRRPERAG